MARQNAPRKHRMYRDTVGYPYVSRSVSGSSITTRSRESHCMPLSPLLSPAVFVVAAIPFRDPIGKFLFLSMMISIVVIPTRLSKGDMRRGPRRAVFVYLIACVAYYGLLRVVIPRV